MKKIQVSALAVMALTVLLSGCQENELRNDTYIPQEGEIVFKVTNNPKLTKSSEDISSVKGVTIPMKTSDGSTFYLEETVTSLDNVAYSPMTKGIPGYTENFHALYKGFDATVYRTGETTAYEENGRFSELVDEEKLIYKRKYGNDLWDKEGLYFFLKATPKGEDIQDISKLRYFPVASSDTLAGSIAFHYNQSQTLKAENQQDILFTSRAVTDEDEYEKLISKDDGINILFHHALTGVKFRVGNDNSGTTKTVIKKVEIIGLYDTGDCVISPETEDDEYKDISDYYSSASAVKWSNHAMNLVNYSQEFSNPTYTPTSGAENKDGTVSETDYQNNGTYTFGTSWYSAAADNNLNNADGSLTFWFIPQAFMENYAARNVTLRVTFCVKTPDTPDGTEIVHTISNFGKTLADAGVEWKAGELRTYTLKPTDVDVDIFDTMDGWVKSGLHVTNTGNVDEYVRMLLLGNWYGWENEADYNAYLGGDHSKEPNILVGYKYKDEAEATSKGGNVNDMVDAWYRGGYKNSDGVYVDPYGTFDDTFLLGNLGDRDGQKDDWADASGGYYYTSKLGPGESINSGTTPLFKSYTVTSVPTIWLPSGNTRTQAYGVHLVMEVAVQAIAVPKDSEDNETWWLQAWYDATNIDKLSPEDTRNEKYVEYYEAGEYDNE